MAVELGPTNPTDPEFFRPIVTGWLGAVKAARKSKKWFDDIADQCRMFYAPKSNDAMWHRQFRSKFMDGRAPKFRLMVNKAFEYVAIMGPSLYWQNPTRELRAREIFMPRQEYFADYGDMADVAYQMTMQQVQQEQNRSQMTRDLMTQYLNYAPGEQPGGGLSFQSKLQVIDMLVTGRGCLWTEKYQYPGSSRVLTGSFYDSNKNLLTDPDACAPDLSDCRYIIRQHVSPRYEVEERFGLSRGALRDKGRMESGDSQSRNINHQTNADRTQGKTFDLVQWYEVFSKCGVGYKMRDIQRGQIPYFDQMGDAIEKVCGDYVYLAICEGVNWPLNAPRQAVENMLDSEIADAFSWPTEYWLDGKWPVEVLDAYHDPDCSWPIAPLAPGLTELMFINIMMSKLANRIWSSSRDFIAVATEAVEEIESVLKDGDDLSIIPLNKAINPQNAINDIVQVLKMPDVKHDVWLIIDRVAELFDRRVGLNELLYGGNPGGVQSRSAADAQNKEKYASVRVNYLSDCVDTCQTNLADKEKFCAWRHVTGKDIQPLLGTFGAQMWDQHVTGGDPEMVVRNMQTTIVANSSRRPNKSKDADNLNNAFQWMMPAIQEYQMQTGDVNPFNAMMQKWGEANELDVTTFELQPIQQQGDPQAEAQQQMQQQQMQHEQEMQQQEMAQSQQEHEMDLQSKAADMEMKQQELVLKQQEMQMKQAEGAMKLQQQADQHEMNMGMQRDKMDYQQASNEQAMVQKDMAHRQGLQQQKQAAKQKVSQQKKPGGSK